MSEHTPLSWFAEGRYVRVAAPDSRDIHVATVHGNVPGASKRAERIVRAVNAHDALVQAALAALVEHRTSETEREQLRAALKLARGEA